MPRGSLAVLLVVFGLPLPSGPPLRVLRATPQTPAGLTDAVTVTFDRPVAGGLEDRIDPASIFRIEPQIAGAVEWRDPVTLRFRPAAPFAPGSEYTVTIVAGLTSPDGSRLERPYSFSFRASPARALTGDGIGPRGARLAGPEPVFRLLFNAEPPRAELERRWSIKLARECGGRSIPVRMREVRRLRPEDPWEFQHTGRPSRWTPGMDSTLDLRRVVALAPAERLPLSCSATLDMPALAPGDSSKASWSFSTYGPLRVTAVRCGWGSWCPGGPIRLTLSTPVRAGELQRRLRLVPAVPFTLGDTLEERTEFTLSADLKPRTGYMLVLDSMLTDAFGQRLSGAGTRMVRTTGHEPAVTYEYGRLLVEREGFGTLAVQHMNLDTLTISAAPIPDSLEAAFLAATWNWNEPLARLGAEAAMTLTLPVENEQDRTVITGIRLPTAERPWTFEGTKAQQSANQSTSDPTRPATLWAIRISSPQLQGQNRENRPVALVQMTDLAVHARIGVDQGIVWVTGVNDGRPRAGVDVALHDARGNVRARARTDAEGLAVLERFAPDSEPCPSWCELEGFVAASQGDDRALVGIRSYDPDLAPWRFDIQSAWGTGREPQTTAVFTERGIYRPNETVYAKAIVRDGALGVLSVPPSGDALQWVFRDREGGVLRDTTVTLGEFGTSDQALRLSADLPLGDYTVEVRRRRGGDWQTFATVQYRVAEYRPPEFLVEVSGGVAARLAGDTAAAGVSARYLFGAPMAGAPVAWSLRSRSLSSWELEIPGAEAYQVGRTARWDDDAGESGTRVLAEGVDTLDGGGRALLSAPLPVSQSGSAAQVTLVAAVTDANRQVVGGGASWLVHPAALYLGARVRGERWFWTAGTPVEIDVAAMRPDGTRLEGVEARGTVVRREWHRVRRVRNGYLQEVGSWVSDTVAQCVVRTTAEDARCSFTPPSGGEYTVTLEARDEAGRIATTSLIRWASGRDWVPWNDEEKLKLDVVADRSGYSVGDTATLLFASPLTDAEAWITVERERVLESRRIRITAGATTFRLPITEALAPNAFVSIVVVRGRSAVPGPLDDPGRPALRVGYTELRVLPDVKRLEVRVQPLPRNSTVRVAATGSSVAEYRPGDTARIAVDVSTAAGVRARAEVTLWAVDKGVLALTGYRTPDLIDLLYGTRGLGVRLASNLVAVAAQIAEGTKGGRAPGGGGGADLAAILRSRFQTTAFFLGSVVTDDSGRAVVSAKLPDNLTTFRVMAVAVTKTDRYGSGEADLLVTRPLVARPALPRFVRDGDRFAAGVVVNQRAEEPTKVRVDVRTAGAVRIHGRSRQEQHIDGLRPAELRFDFGVPADRRAGEDSARFTFEARAQREADAVAVAIPVRSPHRALARTLAGVLQDTATAAFMLSSDIDPARSQLEISVGTSTGAIIAGAARDLRLYPYYCSEQVTSTLLPLLALYRAQRAADAPDTTRLAGEIRSGIGTLLRRQHANGGIGYWSAHDWTTPWLTAYAGRLLLEARSAGFAVDSARLGRMGDYVAATLQNTAPPRAAVAWAYTDDGVRWSERVAAADFLSRIGRANVAVENTLLQQAAQLRWEDRAQLVQLLARRGAWEAAAQLLAALWNTVAVEGRRATLPPDARQAHYFESQARPAAMLLDATLALQPDHAGIGPLIETLVTQTRARPWNTQDYGWAVLALARFEEMRAGSGDAVVHVRSDRRTLLEGSSTPALTGSVPLDGLVRRDAAGRPHLTLSLAAEGGSELPVWWHVTLREVPKQMATQPVDRGLRVERWYERPGAREPIHSAVEGDLVRVRLRITVPAERHFIVLDDALPAGLEAVDLSLRTVSPFGAAPVSDEPEPQEPLAWEDGWYFGAWDAGMWSPFDHKELRDDRVVYSASVLWPGTYHATYLARATTPGVFVLPPAHAEEMYNPAVHGSSAGGAFTVTRAP